MTRKTTHLPFGFAAPSQLVTEKKQRKNSDVTDSSPRKHGIVVPKPIMGLDIYLHLADCYGCYGVHKRHEAAIQQKKSMPSTIPQLGTIQSKLSVMGI